MNGLNVAFLLFNLTSSIKHSDLTDKPYNNGGVLVNEVHTSRKYLEQTKSSIAPLFADRIQRSKRDALENDVNLDKVRAKTEKSLEFLKRKKNLRKLRTKWVSIRKMLDSLRNQILNNIERLENSSSTIDVLKTVGNDLSDKSVALKNKSKENQKLRDRSFQSAQDKFVKLQGHLRKLQQETNMMEMKAMTRNMTPEEIGASLDNFETKANMSKKAYNIIALSDLPSDSDYRSDAELLLQGKIISKPVPRMLMARDLDLEHVDRMLKRILHIRARRSANLKKEPKVHKQTKPLVSTDSELWKQIRKEMRKEVKKARQELNLRSNITRLHNSIDYRMDKLSFKNKALEKLDMELMSKHDKKMDKLQSDIRKAQTMLYDLTIKGDDDLDSIKHEIKEVNEDLSLLQNSHMHDRDHLVDYNHNQNNRVKKILEQIKKDRFALDKIASKEKEKLSKSLSKKKKEKFVEREMEAKYYKLMAKVLEGFV